MRSRLFYSPANAFLGFLTTDHVGQIWRHSGQNTLLEMACSIGARSGMNRTRPLWWKALTMIVSSECMNLYPRRLEASFCMRVCIRFCQLPLRFRTSLEYSVSMSRGMLTSNDPVNWTNSSLCRRTPIQNYLGWRHSVKLRLTADSRGALLKALCVQDVGRQDSLDMQEELATRHRLIHSFFLSLLIDANVITSPPNQCGMCLLHISPYFPFKIGSNVEKMINSWWMIDDRARKSAGQLSTTCL
jgi:hypothetical protein